MSSTPTTVAAAAAAEGKSSSGFGATVVSGADPTFESDLQRKGLAAIEERVPQLALMLVEFAPELNTVPTLGETVFANDADFWRFTELLFTLR